MRVLFTAVPIHGHVLPLLPLAEAVSAAGDEAAVVVPPALAPLVDKLPVIAAGPDVDDLLAENGRRTGGADMTDLSDPFPVASFFAGTRVDLTFDEMLDRARAFGPETIVADEYDAVGGMVAAALDVPLVRHAVGLPVAPPQLVPAMRDLLLPRYIRRGLTEVDRLALVDPWPAALHEPHWTPAADRLAIRARAYSGAGDDPLPPPGDRPRVLVTLGTVLLDAGMLDALVDAVADKGDVDVVATVAPGMARRLDDARGNVRFVGFVPIGRLVEAGLSVVLAAGGAGTVLAALSHGIPMVLWPVGAEKPQNAERVAAAGAGVVIDDPARAAEAVRTVLDDPSYRTAAERVATEIRRAPPAAQVWSALRDRVNVRA